MQPFRDFTQIRSTLGRCRSHARSGEDRAQAACQDLRIDSSGMHPDTLSIGELDE